MYHYGKVADTFSYFSINTLIKFTFLIAYGAKSNILIKLYLHS